MQGEHEISEALRKYREIIRSLLETVEGWHWDDPVSTIYREFFKDSIVVNPEFEREDLLLDLKYRQEHRIPPGYKDAGNEHSGIGDLLIWKTLLRLGEQEKRNLVFVSGDEKSDWRYRSENTALYPRFELVDEYRRASDGKSLLIISFAELLKHFGAPATVIAEVEKEEAVSTINQRGQETRAAEQLAEVAVYEWLVNKYPGCEVSRGKYGFPDLIVNGPLGRAAFEVKYVRRPQTAGVRIFNVLGMARRTRSPRKYA